MNITPQNLFVITGKSGTGGFCAIVHRGSVTPLFVYRVGFRGGESRSIWPCCLKYRPVYTHTFSFTDNVDTADDVCIHFVFSTVQTHVCFPCMLVGKPLGIGRGSKVKNCIFK